jgi:hypothetical protein
MEMEEKWKDIKGYEGLYQISNLGRVKRLKRKFQTYNHLTKRYNTRIIDEKILKGTINKGYNRICLTKDGIEKNHFVHRLVIENFVREVKDNENIDHIDCNKLNNNINNLEIVLVQENNLRAFNNGLRKKTKAAIQPIYLIDDNNNIIKEYKSMNCASKELGINSSHIGRMLKGQQTHVKGYKFKAKTCID